MWLHCIIALLSLFSMVLKLLMRAVRCLSVATVRTCRARGMPLIRMVFGVSYVRVYAVQRLAEDAEDAADPATMSAEVQYFVSLMSMLRPLPRVHTRQCTVPVVARFCDGWAGIRLRGAAVKWSCSLLMV